MTHKKSDGSGKYILQSVKPLAFFKHPFEMQQAPANLFLRFLYLCHVLSVLQMLVCDWHQKKKSFCVGCLEDEKVY